MFDQEKCPFPFLNCDVALLLGSTVFMFFFNQTHASQTCAQLIFVWCWAHTFPARVRLNSLVCIGFMFSWYESLRQNGHARYFKVLYTVVRFPGIFIWKRRSFMRLGLSSTSKKSKTHQKCSPKWVDIIVYRVAARKAQTTENVMRFGLLSTRERKKKEEKQRPKTEVFPHFLL